MRSTRFFFAVGEGTVSEGAIVGGVGAGTMPGFGAEAGAETTAALGADLVSRCL